jgi:hypothetical protein
LGYNASAAGNNAVAMGTSVSNPTDNTIIIGSANQVARVYGTSSWADND